MFAWRERGHHIGRRLQSSGLTDAHGSSDLRAISASGRVRISNSPFPKSKTLYRRIRATRPAQRLGTAQNKKLGAKATTPELYNRRVEQHARGRNVREEVAYEAVRARHYHVALEDDYLGGDLMVAEMLATLCWTAPATKGSSSLSTYSFVSRSVISSSALSSRLDSDATDQFVDPIMR